MQEDVNLETSPLQEIAPTFGFYTYGEFFGTGATPKLLNATLVAVGMREGKAREKELKDKSGVSTKSTIQIAKQNKYAQIITKLVNFSKAITRELEEANQELVKVSITDKLTGIFNRLKLDQVISDEIARSERYHSPFSIILVDIDHFKSVNDTYGHLTGDKVIVKIAELLSLHSRQNDIVGRWGGEEFVVVLPGSSLQSATQVAEKLREAIADTQFPEVGRKTASFGLASYLEKDNPASLISRADKALYMSKNNGRNRVTALR